MRPRHVVEAVENDAMCVNMALVRPLGMRDASSVEVNLNRDRRFDGEQWSNGHREKDRNRSVLLPALETPREILVHNQLKLDS